MSCSSFKVYADQEEDYMKALEAEAMELQNFESPPDGNSDATAPTSEVSPRENEFASALKAALPNTYLVYQKLSPVQKGLVVEAYFVNNRSMAEASRQIFNIYFKKIK